MGVITKIFGGREYYRSATAKRVACGACGGGDDEPVSPIGGEEIAVEFSIDSNHRGGILTSKGYFVQSEVHRGYGFACIGVNGFDNGAFYYFVISFTELC